MGKGYKTPKEPEHFGLKTAKTFIGKIVNLHMKDKSTIINVSVKKIQEGVLVCEGPKNKAIPVFLHEIAYAEDIGTWRSEP
jgi:hypothetical protein